VAKGRIAAKVTLNWMAHAAALKPLSSPAQHLMLIEAVLSVPGSVEGVVVECGCYNGASAVSLSLACALTGRTLVICDSFAGLPRPEPDEAFEVVPEWEDYYHWREGEFRSEQGLDGVRRNVERFGDASVCRFVEGYFRDTLPRIDVDRIALIFEDADLKSSVEDCLRYLWPKLQDGGRFYCHEPWSVHVVSLFYDRAWWERNLGVPPPGFQGSGRGIVKAGHHTNVGYAVKTDATRVLASGRRRLHPGSRGDHGRPAARRSAPRRRRAG
jgi:hypothetical protein